MNMNTMGDTEDLKQAGLSYLRDVMFLATRNGEKVYLDQPAFIPNCFEFQAVAVFEESKDSTSETIRPGRG